MFRDKGRGEDRRSSGKEKMIYLTYYDVLMIITGAAKGIGTYKQSPFVDGKILWVKGGK